VQFALTILNFDFEAEQKQVVAQLQKLLDKYANYDVSIDKEVFVAMLKEYRTKVDKAYLPDLYQTIDTLYGGNVCRHVVCSFGTYLSPRLEAFSGA
jgi:hypothetical protein